MEPLTRALAEAGPKLGHQAGAVQERALDLGVPLRGHRQRRGQVQLGPLLVHDRAVLVHREHRVAVVRQGGGALEGDLVLDRADGARGRHGRGRRGLGQPGDVVGEHVDRHGLADGARGARRLACLRLFVCLRVARAAREQLEDCAAGHTCSVLLDAPARCAREKKRDSLRLPSHVSRSCCRRLPTCLGVLRLPVTLNM